MIKHLMIVTFQWIERPPEDQNIIYKFFDTVQSLNKIFFMEKFDIL